MPNEEKDAVIRRKRNVRFKQKFRYGVYILMRSLRTFSRDKVSNCMLWFSELPTPVYVASFQEGIQESQCMQLRCGSGREGKKINSIALLAGKKVCT